MVDVKPWGDLSNMEFIGESMHVDELPVHPHLAIADTVMGTRPQPATISLVDLSPEPIE